MSMNEHRVAFNSGSELAKELEEDAKKRAIDLIERSDHFHLIGAVGDHMEGVTSVDVRSMPLFIVFLLDRVKYMNERFQELKNEPH